MGKKKRNRPKGSTKALTQREISAINLKRKALLLKIYKKRPSGASPFLRKRSALPIKTMLMKEAWTPVPSKIDRYGDGPPVALGVSALKHKQKTKKFTPDQEKRKYTDPIKDLVCSGRKIRRETLFKRRLIGKGRGVTPKRLMRPWSLIKCT